MARKLVVVHMETPSPCAWAAQLAIDRAQDARDAALVSHAAQQRFEREGRSMLEAHMPARIEQRDYPPGTSDDWRHSADVAYAAAVEAWRDGCGGHEMIAAAATTAATGVSS